MHDTQLETEKALLAAVDNGDIDLEISLDELEQLAKTAGIDCVARITQKRQSIDRATCIGSGKLLEIADFVKNSDIDLVIFDHELSATQLRNIEAECGVAVIDRTMLILEIFSQHAITSEGRLQVELAQHKYLLPRLSGMGISLSRLGGGGGGAGAGARRGKGETKLELDRRNIRGRILHLEGQLHDLASRRNQIHDRRRKDGITTVAIVGYTNVGKSTLLNSLTDAGVLTEDKLFATLDPTARALALPDGRNVMLIDTVGLVRRLPHHLIQAFKSTLEEAVHADLLLNVCDISSDEAQAQVEVTNELLKSIGVEDTPILTVLNKADKVDLLPQTISNNTAIISAKDKSGLEDLLLKISILLPPTQKRMTMLIPYSNGSLIDEIRKDGKIFLEEYTTEGTKIEALVDNKLLHKAQTFEIEI